MKIAVGYVTVETVTAVIRGVRRNALRIYADTPDDPHSYLMFTERTPKDLSEFYRIYFGGGNVFRP